MKTLRIAVVTSIFAIMLSACAGSSPTGQPDLEGTAWMLAAFNQNRPIEGTQLTITFEDGQVSGNAGCNSYGGNYQVKGDVISFSALEMTEIGCMEPEGVMEQEQTYLELLGSAQRYELLDGVLKIFADSEQTMTFQSHGITVAATPIQVQPSPIPPTPTAEIPTMTPAPTFEPPAGFREYQDNVAGVSLFLPESWTITGVIEGDYAIFQSYPEDKYIGGEPRKPGDTKCDLNIQPAGTGAVELIQKWRENSDTTIISEEEIVLQSGQTGIRLEMDNRGRSVSLVTEINDRAILLICFGEPEPFDEFAITMHEIEITTPLSAGDWDQGIKQYQDTETGISINFPDAWVIVEIIPGKRATLQSYSGGKYVGGEVPDPEDTKCDLFIRDDASAEDFIQQMRTNEAITIISEVEITLNYGQVGARFELESMGHSILVITEINNKTVVLTCYGDFTLVDEIAATLNAGE